MKILIITRNLPPLIGGMERLNWHIANELSHKHTIHLLSHTEAKKLAPAKTHFYAVRLNPLPLFLIIAFIKTLIICLTKKPDVLFAGSGLTAPIVVFWAKVFRKKSIVYIHGLDIATNHPIYNTIWVPLIRRADKIIANSTPTYNICLNKKISPQKLSIIHPGVTFPALELNQTQIDTLKTQYNLHHKKVLISVGRLTTRKAILEFIDLSLPTIVEHAPNTILVIIGDTPLHSLNKNLQSKESIIAMAARHNITDHIIFVGNISDDQLLSSWYYLADMHIFPVKHIPEDPEGFGMVAIEAAAHGTPTIAFKTGGIVDAVRDGVSGYLVENGQYHLLCEKIISCLDTPLNTQATKQFSEQFSWKNLNHKISDEVTTLCQKI